MRVAAETQPLSILCLHKRHGRCRRAGRGSAYTSLEIGLDQQVAFPGQNPKWDDQRKRR